MEKIITNKKNATGNNHTKPYSKMKKIKRYMSMAVLAIAGAMMMSCSNEDNYIDEPLQPESSTTSKEKADNIVTLTATIRIEGGAKTRALNEHGVKTFAPGEEIAVWYEKNDGTYGRLVMTLVADAISNDAQSARIALTLYNPKTGGNVKYVYPAAMLKENGDENIDALYNEQDGTLATLASKFDYAKFEGTYNGTELPVGTLRNQLAICKFTIKDGEGTNITNNLTKLTIKNGSDVYYVNTSSQSNIWVALKPITSGNIDIYAAKGKELYRKTVTSNNTLAVNTLTPINVTAPKVEGAVSGLFRINATGDLAYFSQGNLQAEYNTDSQVGQSWDHFNFATNQYDFIGESSGNTGLTTPFVLARLDLFGWSTTAGPNYYGINSSTENNDYSGDFYDWGKANIQNGGGRDKWRTPSDDEWNYIIKTRSASTVKGASNARFVKVWINNTGTNTGTHGYILFPDHYVHPTLISDAFKQNDINNTGVYDVTMILSDWNLMEAAGAVFLPAAGYRAGTTVYLKSYDTPRGEYWTSTYMNGQGSYNVLYGVYWGFGRDNESEYLDHYGGHRREGRSVRLIGAQ